MHSLLVKQALEQSNATEKVLLTTHNGERVPIEGLESPQSGEFKTVMSGNGPVIIGLPKSAVISSANGKKENLRRVIEKNCSTVNKVNAAAVLTSSSTNVNVGVC